MVNRNPETKNSEVYSEEVFSREALLNKGFSSVDMSAYFMVPDMKGNKDNSQRLHIGNLSLVTLGTHRDAFPVTGLGPTKIKGFTNGHRTISGTLVFEVFNRHTFYKVLRNRKEITTDQQSILDKFLPDELPLFDIDIVLVNEQFKSSIISIKGIKLVDSSTSLSVDNPNISEVYSYMAVDYIPLTPLD